METITAYQNGSDTQLDKFVQRYMPLVKMISVFIKRKLPSHIDFEDILQSGFIGLLEARDNYNPDKGASFETYASIRVRGAIIDSLRRNSWISRDTMKAMRELSNAISRIEQRQQRNATTDDIINELGISAEEYFKVTQEINMLHVSTLTENTNDSALINDNDNPEASIIKDGIKKNIKEVLASLPEREQLILSLYYIEEFTFKQIGEVLELTEARVCQLHIQAISRVKYKLKVMETDE